MSRPARRRPPKRRTPSARRAKPGASRSRRAAPKAKAKRATRRATAPVRKARAVASGTGGRAKTSPAPRAPGALVSTEWLAARLGHPRLVVLDGSWHMPQLKRDAREEFAAAHLPGARFFDIDAIADQRHVAAAHAARGAPVRRASGRPRHRHGRPGRRVRHARRDQRGARVVDLPRHGPRPRRGARRRAAPVARRGSRRGERPPRGAAPALQGAAAPGARAHARADAGQRRGAARAGPRRALAGTLRGHGAGAPRGTSRRAYPEEPQPAL